MSNTEERDSTASGSGPKSKSKAALIAASVVAVVALAAAVWFGIGWLDARSDSETADTRDSALTGAQQAVLNMTTLDSANLDESFDTILTSVTGDDMNAFIEDMRASFTEDQRDMTAKTSSELLTGALTTLSEDEGRAEAVVVVATTTTREGYDPTRQRLVMDVVVEDVDGTWKASQATPVGNPVPLNPVDAAPADPIGEEPAPADPSTAPADPSAEADEPAPASEAPAGP